MAILSDFKALWRASRGLLRFVLLGSLVSACTVFEDQSPQYINFRMSGTAGDTVTVIYSKEFVAGVNDIGVTRVEVFGADTVVHVLPIDTVIDVRLEQRLYIQAETTPTDTISVGARVDVDGRNLFDKSGDLFPNLPWQFLYQFNVQTTNDLEVVI